jgi:hypothetical protein
MNRAAHKKLFQKFLYERGTLVNLCDAISSGATDDVNMDEVNQALRKEEAWSQHLAFYDMLKGNYDTLRDFRDSRGRIEERKAEVPSSSRRSRGNNVIALTREVEQDLEKRTVADADLISNEPTQIVDTISVVTPSEGNEISEGVGLDGKIAELQHDQIRDTIHSRPTKFVLDYMKDRSVGGEEKNILSVLYSMLGGVNVMFIAPSGSGKTVILDACISLLSKDAVYNMISSTSNAEVRNYEELNKARVCYIPEAKNYLGGRSDNDHYKMILRLAEGQDYEKKTTGSKTDPGTGERVVEHFTIKANKLFLTADAIESYLDINEEMRRRFIELMTDTSEDHRKEVIKVVAKKMSGLAEDSKTLSDQEVSILKSYINDAVDLQGITVVNPFYSSMSEMVPSSAMRSNSYVQSFFKMVSGSALLHHKDRLVHDSKIYVEMQDVYNVMEVYFQQMCKSMVGYPVFGDDIMNVINEHVSEDIEKTYSDKDEIYFTADDIYERIRSLDGYSRVNIKFVEGILNELFTCKCLDKKKSDFRSKNPSYSLSENSPFVDLSYNWMAGLEDAYANMETENPKLAELWIQKQVLDDKFAVYNPISGKQVDMFDTDSILTNGGENNV